jgi:DNA-binding response OmpR family regulator
MAYLMIVDDDKDFAEAVAVALRSEGHEVAAELDTAVALTEMRKRPPDLVILDVMFPGDDFAGFEMARAMRKCGALGQIPILMLTGVNQAMALNFSTLDTDTTWLPVRDFMDKPVDVKKLVGKVKSMLQGSNAK